MRSLVSIVCLAIATATTWAANPAQEIEALLSYVRTLEGATFIRNETSHSAEAASAHLRLKWEKQQKKIKSAEDFITLCGSKSSLSGTRYKIRFPDGSERFSDEVLTRQLEFLRGKIGQPPAPPHGSK